MEKGIAIVSYGISSVINPPVDNLIIGRTGIRSALLGIVFIAIINMGAHLIEACKIGFLPTGINNSSGRHRAEYYISNL